MEAHGAQILPGCPRTDGPRAMVSRTRSWAVATIISRITVNAVTQILPVANDNNKTITIYRSATSSQLKMSPVMTTGSFMKINRENLVTVKLGS